MMRVAVVWSPSHRDYLLCYWLSGQQLRLIAVQGLKLGARFQWLKSRLCPASARFPGGWRLKTRWHPCRVTQHWRVPVGTYLSCPCLISASCLPSVRPRLRHHVPCYMGICRTELLLKCSFTYMLGHIVYCVNEVWPVEMPGAMLAICQPFRPRAAAVPNPIPPCLEKCI